jgi:parvulin-like peptidyl-prolyl isomerase
LLLVAVIACVSLAACAADGGGAGTTAAATIDGRQISQAQLDQSIPLFKFLAALSQAPCGQQDQASGESADAACARFALGNLIQEDILGAYAVRQHITVDDSKVTQTIQQLEQQLGGADKLDALLKQNGVTRPQLESFARRLLLFREVQSSVGNGQVSDAQLRQQYEQNKLQFTQLHTWQILVKTQAEAQKIEKQVTPSNFQDLANKYSIDPSVKKNHGDLGNTSATQFVEPYVRAALALQPGQISQPVQSQYGWHIIRLISSSVAPFEQVRDQLVQQSSGQAFQTWFQNQLQASHVQVNPRYGRFDPTTGLVNPVRSTATGSESPSPPPSGAGGSTTAPQGSSPTP